MTKQPKQSGQPKRAGRLNIKRIILVIAVVTGAAAALAFVLKSLTFAAAMRSLPFAKDEPYAFTGKGFAYISGGRLNYFDISDEDKNYSEPISKSGARVAAGSGITVVYDSRAIQVVGTQYDTEVNGEIKKISCGAGYVAVYRRGDDGSYALRVFDSTGVQCYQMDLGGGILTDFGFESRESPVLWTSQLVTAGDSFTTTVTTCDLSRKSVTGVFSVTGQLVKNVFITKKSIFLVCTDNIIRYDRNANNESYRILTYGYECLSASFSGGKGRFVMRNKGIDSYIVRLLTLNEADVACESSRLITLPADTVAAAVMKGKFILVLPHELTVYEINDRKMKLTVKHTEAFDKPVEAVLKLGETRLLIVKADEQLLYSIK